MKVLKSGLALLLVATLFVACHKNEIEEMNVGDDYFPMEVGNYWQMEHAPKNEIKGTVQIDNQSYFMFVFYQDTSYYRREGQKIVVKEWGKNPAPKFDLSANVNDTWDYNEWVVQLVSKTDTVQVGNKLFTNCYCYSFDVPQWADEEHSIWLAPGVGFIKESCGFCAYPILKLKKAMIGGQELNF